MQIRKNKIIILLITLLSATTISGCAAAKAVEKGISTVENTVGDINRTFENATLYSTTSTETYGATSVSQPQGRGMYDGIDFDTLNIYGYGYSSLNDTEKIIYDEMLGCIISHDERCTLSTTDVDQLKRVYEVMRADHGEIFWSSGYEYTTHFRGDVLTGIEFKPTYDMTKEARDNYQKQIDEIADEWLSGISDDASDYEKSKYVYETLINNVDFNLDAKNNQNIISVFLDNETVCQGYANAAQYLLQKLDIETTVIIGTADETSHAWNLVKLDGSYYYMDVTWGNSEYASNSSTGKFINYSYLNITSKDLLKTHTANDNLPLPVCSKINDNYFYKEGLYFDTFLPDDMGFLIGEAYMNGESISFALSDDWLYEATLEYFLDNGRIADYCPDITEVTYLADENVKTIMFRFD